jgi:hypothetical protein
MIVTRIVRCGEGERKYFANITAIKSAANMDEVGSRIPRGS